MQQKLNDLLESDPSKVSGRLFILVGALAGFLGTLTPLLEDVHGWGDAFVIVLTAALPRLATWLASTKAIKPSTANAMAAQAFQDGVTVEQARAASSYFEAAKTTNTATKKKAAGSKSKASGAKPTQSKTPAKKTTTPRRKTQSSK